MPDSVKEQYASTDKQQMDNVHEGDCLLNVIGRLSLRLLPNELSRAFSFADSRRVEHCSAAMGGTGL